MVMMKKNNVKCLRIFETFCQLSRSGLMLKTLKRIRKRPNNYFDGGYLCQLLVPTILGPKKKYLINVLCIRLFGFSHQSVFFLIYFVSQRTLEGKIES